MKIINPLKEMQLNYVPENITRFIETNRFLDNIIVNKKDLLHIFENSISTLGYMVDPDYVCYYLLLVWRLSYEILYFNMCFEFRHKNHFSEDFEDSIYTLVYDKYEGFLEVLSNLKNECEPHIEKSYDLLIAFKDYTVTQDKLLSFFHDWCFDYKRLHFNVINVDTILKKYIKSISVNDFTNIEGLLSAITKSLPTLYQMSKQDSSFKIINQSLQDIREKMCIFCQQVRVVDLREHLIDKMESLKMNPITIIDPRGTTLEHDFCFIGNHLMSQNPEIQVTFTFIDQNQRETCNYIKNSSVNEKIYFNITKEMIVPLDEASQKKKQKDEKKKTQDNNETS